MLKKYGGIPHHQLQSLNIFLCTASSFQSSMVDKSFICMNLNLFYFDIFLKKLRKLLSMQVRHLEIENFVTGMRATLIIFVPRG